MNRKIAFGMLGILLMIIFYLIIVYSPPENIIEPPPAILTLNGEEQISGIGTFCWRGSGINWNALCEDRAGIITADEPLSANSPVTAHLRMPLKEPPEELQLNIFQVTNANEIDLNSGSQRAWTPLEGKTYTLLLENEQEIDLSLEPGLYVMSVFARWTERGDVIYGFLIDVQ